jgi:hypothetical protein
MEFVVEALVMMLRYTTFPLGFTRKGMFWGLYTIPRLQDDDVIETWAGRLL